MRSFNLTKTDGNNWDTSGRSPAVLRTVLGKKVGDTVEFAVEPDEPVTFIHFPELNKLYAARDTSVVYSVGDVAAVRASEAALGYNVATLDALEVAESKPKAVYMDLLRAKLFSIPNAVPVDPPAVDVNNAPIFETFRTGGDLALDLAYNTPRYPITNKASLELFNTLCDHVKEVSRARSGTWDTSQGENVYTARDSLLSNLSVQFDQDSVVAAMASFGAVHVDSDEDYIASGAGAFVNVKITANSGEISDVTYFVEFEAGQLSTGSSNDGLSVVMDFRSSATQYARVSRSYDRQLIINRDGVYPFVTTGTVGTVTTYQVKMAEHHNVIATSFYDYNSGYTAFSHAAVAPDDQARVESVVTRHGFTLDLAEKIGTYMSVRDGATLAAGVDFPGKAYLAQLLQDASQGDFPRDDLVIIDDRNPAFDQPHQETTGTYVFRIGYIPDVSGLDSGEISIVDIDYNISDSDGSYPVFTVSRGLHSPPGILPKVIHSSVVTGAEIRKNVEIMRTDETIATKITASDLNDLEASNYMFVTFDRLLVTDMDFSTTALATSELQGESLQAEDAVVSEDIDGNPVLYPDAVLWLEEQELFKDGAVTCVLPFKPSTIVRPDTVVTVDHLGRILGSDNPINEEEITFHIMSYDGSVTFIVDETGGTADYTAKDNSLMSNGEFLYRQFKGISMEPIPMTLNYEGLKSASYVEQTALRFVSPTRLQEGSMMRANINQIGSMTEFVLLQYGITKDSRFMLITAANVGARMMIPL